MFLPDEKATTGTRGIEPLPATGPLRVSMRQHNGIEATPCVDAIQRVRAGQVIGRAEGDSEALPVHAPTSGYVTGIVRVDTPYAADVPAVEIEPDGRNEWVALAGTAIDTIDLDTLIDRTRQAGIGRIVRAAPPPGDLLSTARDRGVRHVIVNALESEPYLTATYRILFEHGHLVVSTADVIARLLGAHRAWLVLDRANSYQVGELRSLAHGTALRVLPLRDKYPQGSVPLLVRSVVGREVPYGGSPLDVGAVVLDAASVWAIGQAIHEGRPCVSRVVTVAGDGVSRPGNYEVPLGTPLHRLIEHVGLQGAVCRVVVGGPMTGVAVSSLDVVTTQRVGAVVLLMEGLVPDRRPGPCIRCGWCLEDCPVGLDPPSILSAVETYHAEVHPNGVDLLDEIARFYPHACLGCGVCSYVCPAGLPLTEGLARARALVPISS